MIKNLIYALIFLLILSCSSNTEIIKKKTSLNDLAEIDYTAPFYYFQNDEELQSKAGKYFIKYTNIALDSIFSENPDKYNLSDRILIEKKSIPQFNDFFEKIERGVDPMNIQINFSTLQVKNSRFLLIPFIKPSLKMVKSNFSGNTLIITDPYYTVNGFELNILLLDLSNNEIVIYGSRKVKRNLSLSYRAHMLYSLDLIFKKLRNH